MSAQLREYPLAPFTECSDERTAGVLLLDVDDDGECKTTANRVSGGWRIVDWEVAEFFGEPHWFERSWHTISDAHIAAINKATGADA